MLVEADGADLPLEGDGLLELLFGDAAVLEGELADRDGLLFLAALLGIDGLADARHAEALEAEGGGHGGSVDEALLQDDLAELHLHAELADLALGGEALVELVLREELVPDEERSKE